MTAPIFPLPNVVLFPDTYLPLHVFEPRYRAMVAAALEGERMLAIVLAHEERPPGAPPAIHAIGGLGRIEVVERRADGRYDLALRGVARVRLGRLAEKEGGWFEAEVEVLGEAWPDLQDPPVADAKAGFVLLARRYAEQVLEGGLAADYWSEALPYPTLVNRAAAVLRVGVGEKQALLELDDVGDRAGAIEAAMREQLTARAVIERFAARRPRRPETN